MSDELLTPEERAAREVAREYQAQFEEDVRWLMTSSRGRRLVSWMLEGLCHIHARAPLETTEMTRWEGGRDVGLALLSTVRTLAPAEAVLMVGEEQERRSAAIAAARQRTEE